MNNVRRYSVNYYGGGGGHFLQELILWCETQNTLVLSYPDGHAHNIFDKWAATQLDNIHNTAEYHTLKPNSTYNFIICHGGTFTAVNKMYHQSLENFRMINAVISDPLEMALCEYNHFYKNQIVEFKFNGIDYNLFPHYKNLMSSRTSEEITMPDWEKVSIEDMAEILLARAIEEYNKNHLGVLKNSITYKMFKEIPHLELTITDIMENSQKVLETISAIVEKPITNAMQYNCENYIKSQQLLRIKYPAYDIIQELYKNFKD